MIGGKKNAARRWHAKVEKAERRSALGSRYVVAPDDGRAPFVIFVSGRMQWALLTLSHAGQKGCTPIDQPAPRWSAYVHELRKLDVPIETITEKHEGRFPGTHARYVLRAIVRGIGDNG